MPTNIPVLLMTGFVIQGHKYDSEKLSLFKGNLFADVTWFYFFLKIIFQSVLKGLFTQ